MFRAFAHIARFLYLMVVTCAPLLFFGSMGRMVSPWEIPPQELIPYVATLALGLLTFGVLPARAWLRIARREGLLPGAYLRAHPVAAGFAMVFSALGSVSFAFWAYAELFVEPVYGEGNSLPIFFVTLLLYAISLTICEGVLMRRLTAASS